MMSSTRLGSRENRPKMHISTHIYIYVSDERDNHTLNIVLCLHNMKTFQLLSMVAKWEDAHHVHISCSNTTFYISKQARRIMTGH